MDWLNFIIFTLISSFEYVAGLVFIAALFRFRYFLRMKMHIFMVCVLLSYVSYTTRTVYGLAIESTLIQIGLMMLFIWLLFKVQFYYAALMSLTGHVAYGAVQFLLLFVYNFAGIFTLEDLEALIWPSHILPLSSSLIFLMISRLIIKKNWGFSFVPDRADEDLELKTRKITVILVSIAILIFILSSFHRIGITLISNIYVSSLIYIAAFVIFLIISINKERKND
jgi:hypothetical protein